MPSQWTRGAQVITPVPAYASPALQIVGTLNLFMSMLARGWFSNDALNPGGIAYNLFFAICTCIADVYEQVLAVKLMMRLDSSASADPKSASSYVDTWFEDYFGSNLPRSAGESDTNYISRGKARLGAKLATKSGVLTVAGYYGSAAVIEPFRADQVGALGSSAFAFGSPNGAVGSMVPSPQLYVTPDATLTSSEVTQAHSEIMAARPCGMNLAPFQVNSTQATPI